MTRTLIPRCGKTVDSQDFEKYWSCDIITDYVKSGFTVAAQCPNILAVDASTGIGRVKGLYIENTTACENVTCLTMCDVNFIYVTISRTGCVPTGWTYTTNLTGITPTDSLLIATATTNATTVTAVCNTHVTRPINLSQAGDQVFPLNTSAGCYASPCSASSSSSCGITNLLCDPLTGNCNWCEGGIGTDIVYSACCDRYNFSVSGGGNNTDHIFHDTCSQRPRMTYRGKLRFSTLNTCNAGAALLVIAMSSVCGNHDVTSGDWAGFDIIAQCGCACPVATARITDNLTYTNGTTSAFAWTPVVCTDYFWRICWDSGTCTLAVSIYTAACCMCLVETETITSGQATTADCVRYLHLETRTTTTNANTITGFWDDIIADFTETAALAVDNNVCTRWISMCANNPNIVVDTGSAQELPSLAINLCRTDTTETVVEIRASTTCCCFTACDTVRTLFVSDFTDDTYRFITLPRSTIDKRYVQIFGQSCCVVLAINEIKYDTQTAAVIDKGHFHNPLSATSTSANSLDSN